MNTREFVEDLFINNRNSPTEMSIEDAAADLKNYRLDGWELPEGITAEEYAEIWNELAKNYKGENDMNSSYYAYEELRAAAFRPGATPEDIDALGEWFARFGQSYWNGESYDADEGYRITPIYDEDPIRPWQCVCVGYELD